MSTVEKSVEKGVRPQNKHLKPIKPGQVLNPNGRGKGVRDIRTVMWEAMKKIGETKNMSPEEVEILLHQSGIAGALKGNVKYYNAVNDRLYGPVDKSKQTVNVNIGTSENTEAIKELTAKLNDIYRA